MWCKIIIKKCIEGIYKKKYHKNSQSKRQLSLYVIQFEIYILGTSVLKGESVGQDVLCPSSGGKSPTNFYF